MIHEHALLVSLSLGLPPVAKTDKRITQRILSDNGAEKGSLRAVKRLLPEQALEPIKKLHAEATDYYKKNTCAWAEGERILASATFMEFSDELRKLESRAEMLADEFAMDYQGFIEEARYQLNGAFNSDDYLPHRRIRGRFRFKVDYKPVPEGGDFRISIMRGAMDELRASLDRRVREATRGAQCDLAGRIAKPLAHIVNCLNDEDAGFRDSLIGNLREICDLIPKLNITGDQTLEAVRQRIHTDLYHADCGVLKENPVVRTATARKAQAILDTMGEFFGEG